MKNIFLVFLLFFGINCASAQEVYTSSGKNGYHKKTKKKKGYDPDKLILGGQPTIDFSTDYTIAGVSLITGYRLTRHFAAGIGLGYLYASQTVYVDPVDPLKASHIRANIIFPSVWARYYVFRNIYATAAVEYDIIRGKEPGYDNNGILTNNLKFSDDNTCFFVGAGYRQPLGGRLSIYAEVIYDVLQGKNSMYSPGFPTTFRFGFATGL
jgi:hypothetical protein